MLLKQKEKDAITELQTQEKICVEKYRRYKEQAKDPELKTLFGRLEQEEQKHYDTLGQVLNGKVPSCDCNDSDGKNYKPQVTYDVWHRTRINSPTTSWLRIASERKSMFLPSITQMYSSLRTLHCVSFWQTFRLRSRTMRRCCTNTRQQTAWHKTRTDNRLKRDFLCMFLQTAQKVLFLYGMMWESVIK